MAKTSRTLQEIQSTAGSTGRSYEFSIIHTDGREDIPMSQMVDYKIKATIDLGIESENRPSTLINNRFCLEIDTLFTLSETIKYFKELGISSQMPFTYFCYFHKNKNITVTYPGSPRKLRLGELKKRKLDSINEQYDNSVLVSIEKPFGNRSNQGIGYKWEKEIDNVFHSERTRKIITYYDTCLDQPEFDEILKASVLKLNKQEKQMLEQIILTGIKMR